MDCQVSNAAVLEILSETDIKQELLTLLSGEKEKAICFPKLTGRCRVGDRVVLNTTAVSLSLGSGGYHFVMAIINNRKLDILQNEGHIMKLRYTPLQGRVLSVEEPDSPYHQLLAQVDDIAGLPVIVGTLHSMLAPVCLGFNYAAPDKKLVYLMSDGAALPLALSRQVEMLTKLEMLKDTITFNHAFGGNFEAVNVYSALLTAKHVCRADAAVILMGPGIVGTNTRWGTTALEQGVFLNAIHTLKGTAIGLPRISFADPRQRHLGISHHSLTVFNRITEHPCSIPLPMDLKEKHEINSQLSLLENHLIKWINTNEYRYILTDTEIELKSMGRTPNEDLYFFDTAFASGLFAGWHCVQSTPLE
ncbi:MAG: DUF3866 family protein [Firmicutes bacterium]|nr:DUF3866 family protein [Bacillota bacterium]